MMLEVRGTLRDGFAVELSYTSPAVGRFRLDEVLNELSRASLIVRRGSAGDCGPYCFTVNGLLVKELGLDDAEADVLSLLREWLEMRMIP